MYMPLLIGAALAQDLDSTGIDNRQPDSRRKRLAERVWEAIRTRNYSRRTGKTYWYWIRYFIFFHGKRHPAEMGAAEVSAFLSWLATQNQALHALLFLYKQVLGQELPWLEGVVRPKRPARLPTVLTEEEVARLLAQLDGTAWLMASLLYGVDALDVPTFVAVAASLGAVALTASYLPARRAARGNRAPCWRGR